MPVVVWHHEQGFGLLVEALTILVTEQFPVPYDAVLAGSQNFGGRQLVALLAVSSFGRRQQIPDIVVVPEIKRNDMVNVKALPQGRTGPDALQPIQP